MKPNLIALPGTLALVLACGDGKYDRETGGAGVEDTTAAPSADRGTPPRDTTTATDSVRGTSDTVGTGGGSPQSSSP
jgi:hypothetical protein